MRFFLLLFSVMVYSFTWAQDRYTESVPAVGESGYYRIALSQEMIGVSSDHAFKGIRIKDQQDKELPYFVEEYPFLKNSIKYVDLKQLKSGTDSKNSFVVVENDDELESLYIQIKSLDVLGKQVQIRGSHDGKQFYLVKAKTDVSVFERQFSKNDEVFEVHFPKGNYRYYEIQLSNSQEQPMEIWSIKTIKSLPLPEPEWQLLPLGPLLQKDSIDNKSYIYFPEFKYQ